MSQTKITVKIHTFFLKAFDNHLDRLFIKRDAFLNAIIKEEVKNLANDMKGKRLTQTTKKFISGELKRMGTTQVNIVVEKETADALNTVVAETNMVRDAFVNRLIMLLSSSEYLDLAEYINSSEFESYVEPISTNPIEAMEAIYVDPLFYLRTSCEERHDTGLYLLELPKKLTGFTCYMDESMVPGTIAYEQTQLDIQEKLSLLFEL